MTTFLRKLFIEDFFLKLFALIVAVWIYATVRNTLAQDREKTFLDLPVLVLSTASQVGELKVSPDRVNVTVRGEAQALDRLLAREVHPVVDFTLPEAGALRRHRVVVSTPPGVTPVSVRPNYVELIEVPAPPPPPRP